MPAVEFGRILDALVSGGVDFILVGGVAAVLQGSGAMTFDVDIVHSRSPENIARLLTVLDGLDGHYRMRPDLRPTADRLASDGHQLLMTRLGPLDVLGAIEQRRGYQDLLPHTELVKLRGASIRILTLEFLLELKENSADPKDQSAAAYLRAALAARSKNPSG